MKIIAMTGSVEDVHVGSHTPVRSALAMIISADSHDVVMHQDTISLDGTSTDLLSLGTTGSNREEQSVISVREENHEMPACLLETCTLETRCQPVDCQSKDLDPSIVSSRRIATRRAVMRHGGTSLNM